MTTYEKCKAIRRLIMTRAAEVMVYTSWGSDFAGTQITEIPTWIRGLDGGESLFDIQPAELTRIQMEDLCFGRMTDTSSIHLIPLWLYHFLADTIQTTSTLGSPTRCKKNIGTDHRYGCLAFGVTPSKFKKEQNVKSF